MSNMQLDTLRRIVQEINASVSLHDSLDIMVNHVAEAMHVDVCSIYLLDTMSGFAIGGILYAYLCSGTTSSGRGFGWFVLRQKATNSC